MSNNLRTRNGMPFNFVNGLKVRGMDIESLIPGIEGIPEAGSKYQFAGNGSNKAFTLPVTPYNKDAIDVYVKQLYVHPDDYTLVGDTVTLTEAPPAVVAGETYNVVIKVSLTTLNGYVNANRVSFEGENLDDILEKGKPLANYSALRAYAGAATQVRITDPGIAGFFYYDAADTISADNGGTVIVSSNGKRWKRIFEDKINVKWFGVTGNGNTDDTINIQAAFNYASSILFSEMPIGGISTINGNTYIGICPRIVFPKGVYLISSTINHSGAYADIDGGESILKCSDSFPNGEFAFNISNAWQLHVKGFRFYNTKNAFKVKNSNLAIGQLRISNMHMQGGDVFLRLSARSSLTIVDDFRLDAVKHPLVIPGNEGAYSGADVVKFIDGWVVPGVLSTDYDGFFRIENGTYAPKLILENVFYAPSPQSANDVVVVRVDGIATVDIDSCLFGGESGQVPLVGWHATNGVIGTTRGGVIRIKDTSHYLLPSPQAPTLNPSGKRATVELFSLPNVVSFENIIGTSDNTSEGLINFRSDERTFDAALAINNSLAISFLGHTGNGTTYMTRSAFNKLGAFIKTPPKMYYGYLVNLDNAAVASSNKLIALPEPERTRHKRLRLCIAQVDGGNETYSEYIVTCDYAGNFIGFTPIKEGTQTTAPRIFIDTNNLYVRTNTASSATWSFYYQITQVSANYQGYA